MVVDRYHVSICIWEPICSQCHSFTFLSTPDCLFMSNSGVFLDIQRTWSMLPSLCCLFTFVSLFVLFLVISCTLLCVSVFNVPCYVYYFGYFMFFVVCVCSPSLDFILGLHAFDCRYNFGSLDYSSSRHPQLDFMTYRLTTYWTWRLSNVT